MEENKSNVPEIKINIGEKKRFINLISIILIILITTIVTLVGYNYIKSNKERKITIASKSEIIKALDISELNTYRYNYNGIATKKNEKGKIQYYVKYDGSVTIGIDFKEIEIKQDDENKKIIVKLPKLKITNTNIIFESLNFIIMDKKIKSSAIRSEAFELCKKHLEDTTNNDKDLFKSAEENAKHSIESLIKPFLEEQDNEYVIEFE